MKSQIFNKETLLLNQLQDTEGTEQSVRIREVSI